MALLEEKTRALDQAAPLAGWELPGCFAKLRRLLETFRLEEATQAIQEMLYIWERSRSMR